jgi:hypothetical protein
VTARLAQYLTGSLSGAYIDAKYDSAKIASFNGFPTFSASGGDVSGNELLRTSKYQYAASLAWKQPVRSGLDWSVRGDLAWRDKQFADATNETITPSITTLNMTLGLSGDKWMAELWGHNLTNENGAVAAYRDVFFGNALPNGTTYGTPSGVNPAGSTGKNSSFAWRYSVSYGDLREFGLTLRYKF